MEPILENIELPSPNPQAVPNWNPANAPVPPEFYDNAPEPRYQQFNDPFVDYNNYDGDSAANSSTFELDFSDPEFQSYEDESDVSSVKSGDSRRIAKGGNRVDKRREWGLPSPVSPIPRNSKKTETCQYHLISPVVKDRYHYVSKDNPKFKELEGKDPEFDECRYKYFVICVGSHYWKRTRNQVVRAGRSGARRQKQVQVRDRRMNVQTFYYSLTFELETMAPLKLRSFSDVIKAIKTQIPPQAPQLFSVTYTTFDSPVKFTVTSEALAQPPVRSNNHTPELAYGKGFKSAEEVDPFAAGNFMDNLEELSQLDSVTAKSGPILVTSVQCTKVDSFGNISPVQYTESRNLECDTSLSNVMFEAGLQELVMTSSPLSKNEKSLQLTRNSSIFQSSSGEPHAQVTLDLSLDASGSVQKAPSTPTFTASSPSASRGFTEASAVNPPPPPERTAASMNKSPDRYVVSPVIFQKTESDSAMDPAALNTSWNNMGDPTLQSDFNKLNQMDIVENPMIESLYKNRHKCAFTGADGLCRCCHFSHAHAHEGKYKDMSDSNFGTDSRGSNSSLDTLINQLWDLSNLGDKETKNDKEVPDWSCKIKPSSQGKHENVPGKRRKKRPTSPRLPENFVADMDEILQQQIADLERATSASPLPKSLSQSPTLDMYKPQRPTTLGLKKLHDEDRSQNYEVDALDGDERLQRAYMRYSPVDSDFDTSSVSSYNSLSPQPKKDKKSVVFKDEKEAFDYFRVKHYDSAKFHPQVINKSQTQVSAEAPIVPPRRSSKSRSTARMFCSEEDTFDYFKISHFPDFKPENEDSQEFVRARQEYIEQLNNYTPRIQPAVPKRRDSSEKFQKKLMELSLLSAACGEVADKIKNDHQEYWGALTEDYKVPESDDKSLVSEAYQNMSVDRRINGGGSMESSTIEVYNSPSQRKKAVQTDMKKSGLISSAVSDNIVNMASSVSQTTPTSPKTLRNEIRIDVTPSPEVRIESPKFKLEGHRQNQSQGQTGSQSNHETQGRGGDQGFWGSFPVTWPRLKPQNYKRSVTWCDDLTSTDDDRMSDSSASVTPDRKLEPTSSSLKSIQKSHMAKKKKKKVSWSDDYNTDDERHSSSTSLSSLIEPNSPDSSRHFSNTTTNFGPIPTSPLVYKDGSQVRSPNFPQRNISWSDPNRIKGQCPVYGQPILSQPNNNSQNPWVSGPDQAHSQMGTPGSAKKSLGLQRFKTENKFPVPKFHTNSKPLPFPVETQGTKLNGHRVTRH